LGEQIFQGAAVGIGDAGIQVSALPMTEGGGKGDGLDDRLMGVGDFIGAVDGKGFEFHGLSDFGSSFLDI